MSICTRAGASHRRESEGVALYSRVALRAVTKKIIGTGTPPTGEERVGTRQAKSMRCMRWMQVFPLPFFPLSLFLWVPTQARTLRV